MRDDMKKIFKVEGKKTIVYLEDYRLFEVYDWDHKRKTFLSEEGNEVPRPDFRDYPWEHERCYDDPTGYEPLGDGYYMFTTHPVEEDPDGPYGCFGIKDKNGEIVVDEKYWQIRSAFNGLFPVQEIEGDWGCVNERGELVVPCIYWEPPHFNKYGLGYGNHMLVDMQGNEIAGTEFNCIEYYNENDRYIPIILTTEEQDEQISKTGTAEGVKKAIFDTKLREYVIRGIPENSIYVDFYDGEPEVIIAAAQMLNQYDNLRLESDGIIIGTKGNRQVVYDYYK